MTDPLPANAGEGNETPSRPTDDPERTRPERVLLIGWDAADWKHINPLIEAGEMPNLKRFVEEGSCGNISTLQPALSPMLWTSIATGKLADKHGVLGFAEADGSTGKARPVTSGGRRCKALWNILSDRGRPAGAVNWYASHPAEPIDGFVVTDRYAHPTGPLKPDEPDLGWATVPGSVWPSEDLEPLSKVRVHPGMIDKAMVAEFVPQAATDEGSARWPKIAELRTLLAHSTSVHNAATAYLQERPWDFFGIYYDAIDRFAHAFMEYSPPKMPHISDEDFERYSGVMRACYRLHDMMLGRMMNLIDERTVVCLVSDHGFHSDHLRPGGTSAIKDGKPVLWHRQYGVIGLWGPGIRRGQTIAGAGLLDVAPTILSLLGMPVPRDMDGTVLSQAFTDAVPAPERIDTYETEGDPKPEAVADTDDPLVAEQMLEQLRQLGYVGSDDAEDVTIDRSRNLGIVFLSTGRPEKAAEAFESILQTRPEDTGARMSLASALISAGDLDGAERCCEELAAQETDRPRVEMLRAIIASARGDQDTALERLDAVEAMDPDQPGLNARLAQLHLGLGNHAEAEQRFERALKEDPEDASALDGIGQVYQKTDRPEDAALAHMRAIALEQQRPGPHLNLARSLRDAGRTGWALEAVGVALRMAPGLVEAHELAADLYEREVGNRDKAAFHRARIQRIGAARSRPRPASENTTGRARPRSAPTRAGAPATGGSRTTLDLPDGPVTIVSGLPRSGTSLMMRMLDLGGLPALTDRSREADEDNPRGYYELDAVKSTARDPSWIQGAGGHAVKVIHVLLRSLPPGPSYRVVLMRRRIDEIVASQRTMLDRMDRPGGGLDAQKLSDAYQRDLDRARRWLGAHPGFEVLEIDYNELVSDPAPSIDRIVSFVGTGLDRSAMLRAVDPSLYRQRSGEASPG